MKRCAEYVSHIQVIARINRTHTSQPSSIHGETLTLFVALHFNPYHFPHRFSHHKNGTQVYSQWQYLSPQPPPGTRTGYLTSRNRNRAHTSDPPTRKAKIRAAPATTKILWPMAISPPSRRDSCSPVNLCVVPIYPTCVKSTPRSDVGFWIFWGLYARYLSLGLT
jgi:hypothetical protein